MVTLDKETIEVINKIEKAVEGTEFEFNKFEVMDPAIEERQMIMLDIRRKIKDNGEEKDE